MKKTILSQPLGIENWDVYARLPEGAGHLIQELECDSVFLRIPPQRHSRQQAKEFEERCERQQAAARSEKVPRSTEAAQSAPDRRSQLKGCSVSALACQGTFIEQRASRRAQPVTALTPGART